MQDLTQADAALAIALLKRADTAQDWTDLTTLGVLPERDGASGGE